MIETFKNMSDAQKQVVIAAASIGALVMLIITK